MPLSDVLMRDAASTFSQAGIESATLDARLLMQHVLSMTQEELILHSPIVLNEAQHSQWKTLVAGRAARRPIAHLLGKREFYRHQFAVTPDTLDPRPDSEMIIEAVMEHGSLVTGHESWGMSHGAASTTHAPRPMTILDLGTGTGCLLLSLLTEYPQAVGVGGDISKATLDVASANAERLGLKNRVTWVESDWLLQISGVFDVIVSNPPYIPSEVISTLAPEVALYEPKLALDGGDDGLDCYRAILSNIARHLAPQGIVVLEMGFDQAEALQALIVEYGLTPLVVKKDWAGNARCITLTHST